MTYFYFVSYTYTTASDSEKRIGSAELSTNRPITHLSQIRELETRLGLHLQDTHSDFLNVLVTNYILLREED